MIFSLANVGKCFVGRPAMAGRFVWVCQGLCALQFVFPSILLSIFPSSFCLPFCLFRSVSFLGTYTLVFVIFGMRLGLPQELFVEFLQKNLVWAKINKKWSKMTPKWDFSTSLKTFVINFSLKHGSSYTNTIFGKILFLEL